MGRVEGKGRKKEVFLFLEGNIGGFQHHGCRGDGRVSSNDKISSHRQLVIDNLQ